MRLKGCWLEGVSLLPHWPARTGNWLFFCQNARYILVVFLLTNWGGGERKNKKKEVLHVCLCYCAQQESSGHFAKKKNQLPLFDPTRREHLFLVSFCLLK